MFRDTLNGIFALVAIFSAGCTAKLRVGDLLSDVSNLAITTNPALGGDADTALSKQPIVTALDALNHGVSSYRGTITFSGYSDKTCTTLVAGSINSGASTNQSGVVSFSGVQILKTNVISIKATDGKVNSSCLTGFSIRPGALGSISFSTQPSSTATSGISFIAQPVIQAKDANSNTLGTGAAITLSITSGTSTLGCTTNPVLTNAFGLASFSGCNLTGPSGIYTLTGGSGGKSVLSNSIALTLPPSLNWSTLNYDFGSLTIGNYSSYQSFTLSNTGLGEAITCATASLSNTNDFTIFSDGCGTSNLAAGASCVVNVRANPTSIGVKTATLSRSCIIGGLVSTTTNGLATTGSGTVTVAWNQNTLNFGSIRATSQSNATTFYFQNLSLLTATACTATTNSNSTDFTISSDTCGISNLNPFDQCSIQVKASPATAGLKTATISRTCAGTTASISISTTALASGLSVTSMVSSEEANHTCALMSNGSVQCWGSNYYGQLGDGTTVQKNTTTSVTGLSGLATAIAIGSNHTCALISGGTVQCWGANGYGQLGDGTAFQRITPTAVTGLTGVAAIAAGNYRTCALISGGTVQCWGYNSSGQLGDGTTTNRNIPTLVTGLSGVTALTAGDYHTCALISGGTVKCWGYNSSGQLGDGTTTNRNIPTLVAGLSGTVSTLASGAGYTCALISGGAVQCWGWNFYGQLGDGTATQRIVPTTVSGLSGTVTSLTSGFNYNCALITGGTLQCWGDNSYGQLGDGTATQRNVPTTVSGLTGTVTSISLGFFHACALISGGSIQCWGDNYYGQLGDGTVASKSIPISTPSLSGSVAALNLGHDYTCALISGGTVQCWGGNFFGQLGDGTTTRRNNPVLVAGLSGVVNTLVTGNSHTCALISGGTVQCWGWNFYGQLGDGTITQRTTPTSAGSFTGAVTAMSAGNGHTCALITGGDVQCWGDNSYGQLGDGTTTRRTTPTSVTGLSGTVIALTTGSNHTCALISGGTIQCWGWNFYGQLGDGTITQRTTPTLVGSFSGAVTALSAGNGHTCALITGGDVQCWGDNSYGQLGDGTTTRRTTPTSVTGLSRAVASLVAGLFHTCALNSGGTVQCWGANNYSQLGDGTQINEATPKTVLGQFSISAIYTGSQANHTCVLKSGTPSCFGYNSSYQVFNSLVKSTVSGF